MIHSHFLALVLAVILGGDAGRLAKANNDKSEPICANEGKTTMTDFMRRVFLDAHNGFRSALASGNFPYGRLTPPPAKNMEEMRYNCEYEDEAFDIMPNCTADPVSEINNGIYAVNIANIRTTTPHEAAVAKQVMNNWMVDMSRSTIRNNMLLAVGEAQPAARMGWHNNNRLGCAIRKCSSSYLVLCIYGTGGPVEGLRMYEPGHPPCSECPQETECNRSTKLCVRKN